MTIDKDGLLAQFPDNDQGLIDAVNMRNVITETSDEVNADIVNLADHEVLAKTAHGGICEEAPVDGGAYVRQNSAWVAESAQPIGGINLDYTWSENTTATDPGVGGVKGNNTDDTLITELYISATTDLANDASSVIEAFLAGDWIGIWEVSGDQEGAYYEVQSPPVDNTGWYTIAVTHVPGTIGGMDDGADVRVMYTPNPANAIGEAPQDGSRYGRQNATWLADPIQTDAPSDSQPYVREDAAWKLLEKFPARFVRSGATIDTPVDGSAFTYTGADGVNLTSWAASLPAGGNAASYEYSCSVDFLAPGTGSYSVTINVAWKAAGDLDAIALNAGDEKITVILRTLADGTIQWYGVQQR